MKRIILLLFLINIINSATAAGKRKYSQFAGDINGDGFTDIAIASGSDFRNFFGMVKIYFGTAEGINSTAGWTYTCDITNFLESHYSVKIIGDVNGDGTDELCMLLTNLSNKKSGRSHQSLFIFYGKKEGFGNDPDILKIEDADMDKYSLRDYFAFDYTGDGYTDILAVSSKRNYKIVDAGWTDTEKKWLLYRGSDSGINNQYEIVKDIQEDILFKDAGDLNNDGINDMLTEEPDDKQLVLTQFLSTKNKPPDKKLFTSYKLLTAPTSDRIYNVTAGDFNADTYDDYIIMHEDKSPLLSMKKPDSTTYTFEFYSGSADGLKTDIAYTWKTKTAPGVILNITACNDLNGDGYGDFILQKFTPNKKQQYNMEAFIVWGSKDGLQWDTSGNFNTFFHSLKYADFGITTVEALGDINNDGYADLLLSDVTIVYGCNDGKFKTTELKFL